MATIIGRLSSTNTSRPEASVGRAMRADRFWHALFAAVALA